MNGTCGKLVAQHRKHMVRYAAAREVYPNHRAASDLLVKILHDSWGPLCISYKEDARCASSAPDRTPRVTTGQWGA